MEKSAMNFMDNSNSINYAEGRNATPSAPPAYDEAMASAYNVHDSMGYEQSHSLTAAPSQHPAYNVHSLAAAPPQHPVGQNFPAPGSFSQQHVTTVVTAPTIGALLPVGPRSIKTSCPTCNRQITSRTTTKNSTCCKFVLCTILCLSGVCLPCACLPFCMCGPARVTHFCPKCNAHLGTWVSH